MDGSTKQIARDRIRVLFEQAESIHKADPELSSRYVEMARKIAMSARIRLPLKYRRQVCRKCNSLLVVGENCRVRTRRRREPHLVVTCLDCGFQKRIPFKKRKENINCEGNKNQNETPRQA